MTVTAGSSRITDGVWVRMGRRKNCGTERPPHHPPHVQGGGNSAGKIPYFILVRNFPRTEFYPCKPPYHRMPCASPRAPICFVPALLQVLSTNREGGAGSLFNL